MTRHRMIRGLIGVVAGTSLAIAPCFASEDRQERGVGALLRPSSSGGLAFVTTGVVAPSVRPPEMLAQPEGGEPPAEFELLEARSVTFTVEPSAEATTEATILPFVV